MPGCAAINCSNSAQKKFLMRRFPKDPVRRKEWLIKMKRDKWTPTDNSCLCEVHFAPEMWEKTREDGTRKLKANAVPTIFCFSPPDVKKRKSPTKRTVVPQRKEKLLPENMEVTVGSDIEPQPSVSQQLSTSSEDSANIVPHLDLMKKLDRYERMFLIQERKISNYKRLQRNMRRNLKNVETNVSLKKEQDALSKQLFNNDQIVALGKKQQNKSTKFMKWSNETVTKSLKLKFSCGNNGYDELLKQGYPLPSIRTLQRRMQNLKFNSGILNEVFEFLKIKVQYFASHEKDCVLILDEMAITPGNVYDSSLCSYFGNVTLPEHTGVATHVLVFMLGGVTTRWKQVVAYYFTSDSVNGSVFTNIIEDLFKKADEVGLNILSVTSDMGGSNQALWRTWGITAGRYSQINCKIPHPLHLHEFIYVFADIPHLFKNIKAMLITNKIIIIPDDIVEKHNLPSKEVLASHISEVVAHQKDHFFKLAPKLSEEDLVPTHFAKMKVSTSTNVVSHTVSSALKFLAEELDKNEYLTTAWFLDQVERWFYLMTSRHPSSALSKYNLEVYNASTTFLKDFMNLFNNMIVGHKKIWKPSQTGVLISTQSMLELQAHLLDVKQYKFILTSRFSQDCLENLFSALRNKQIVPNAAQVKNNMKLICVSQYLKNPSSSSYEEDDREFISGFLDTLNKTKPRYYDEIKLPAEVSQPKLNLNFSELNSLYNISGYILQSIIKTSKTCSTCINAAGSKIPIYKTFTRFTNIKRFRENILFFCSEELFYFYLDMETIFVKYFSIVSPQNINLKDFYFKEMSILKINLPDCHKLKYKIIKRYIVFRLKIMSKKNTTERKRFASKSVAGHAL